MVAPHHIKYPRTPHLPWSPGASDDDIWHDHTSHFRDREVVVTEKLDGENTTLYRDHMHARSLDSRHHPSRDWVKQLHGAIAHLIPERWRICGENVYARHSIAYEDLGSYFYVFSVWDEANRCLSWDETIEWSELLGLELVPVLARGTYDGAALREMVLDTEVQEGYVVRLAESFAYAEFARSVAKWVRPDHVQTDTHWMFREIVPNGLRSEEES